MKDIILNILNKAFQLLKKIIKILLFVYIGFGFILFIFQERYIYYPDKTDFQDCSFFKNSEKISFNSSRGYFTKQSQEKIIVFYHGNAGRACDRYYLNDFFIEQGYSTFFVEYSGYGESSVNPSMSILLQNVTDTINFLKTQNFKDIIVIGESIGVGPASYHALHSNINKIILISAYNNFADVASSHYPIYPMHLLLRNNFNPEKWLDSYNGSVSIIVAENDEIILNKLSQRLYEKLSSNLKKLYVVKNVGHNTIYEKNEFYSFLKLALE